MQDLILDENNDMIIEGNDAVLGESDLQHQHLLLLIPKGAIKQSPLGSVGVATYLNDSDIQGMLHDIRSCFIADGMHVAALDYDEYTGDLDYDATYSN